MSRFVGGMRAEKLFRDSWTYFPSLLLQGAGVENLLESCMNKIPRFLEWALELSPSWDSWAISYIQWIAHYVFADDIAIPSVVLGYLNCCIGEAAPIWQF